MNSIQMNYKYSEVNEGSRKHIRIKELKLLH